MMSKLTAFAMDFASYLVQKTKYGADIKNIILFGSAARGEAGKSSDVDIFVDVIKEKKNFEAEATTLLENFRNSTKYKHYWKPLGITNEIKPIVGELDKWKDLKLSIVSNGITLYGKYKSDVKGKHRVFLIWENIKPNSKRVLFNKQMFGYKHGRKRYDGLLQKFGGEKLGKGCITIPLENSNIFHGIFRKHKISVKIKKVIDYSS